MLINADLLLQYQRCKRRPFLDIHGDRSQRDKPTDLLIKLQQDKITHQKGILGDKNYTRPIYPRRDWRAGAAATLELMQQGVDCIYQGVLVANFSDIQWYTLPSVTSVESSEYTGVEVDDPDKLQDKLQVAILPEGVATANADELVNSNISIHPNPNSQIPSNLQSSLGNSLENNSSHPSDSNLSNSNLTNSNLTNSNLTNSNLTNQVNPQLDILVGQEHTLISSPDLLIKQPGKSQFGDWMYIPASIELGKRPKQDYQVVVAYHAQVLGIVQDLEPQAAWLMLRGKDAGYPVDLRRWMFQMQRILLECLQNLADETAPEVFISRQKCSLCHWYSTCYEVAKKQQHLSLLPGVTPVRYTQLQALDITSPESLAKINPIDLENLPGFDSRIAVKIVMQAKSIVENRPFILPILVKEKQIEEDEAVIEREYISLSTLRPHQVAVRDVHVPAEIELYFDIEAQPDLNLNYLLGVLVVDKQAKTEEFYSFLAENVEEEESVWQQFLNLVNRYPDAPIYHFCVYEFDTVKRLAKLYHTPYSSVLPVLSRFVDVYEELIRSVTLPIESYALKAIAKWLGFEWRDNEASGAKCIYWYDQWLQTGDRALLEVIQRYNEDDCRATRSVKNWLVDFIHDNHDNAED
jgi:predicted RecB family nuclease